MALTQAQRAAAKAEIEHMVLANKFTVPGKELYDAIIARTGIKRHMANNIICHLMGQGKISLESYRNSDREFVPIIVRSDCTQQELIDYAKAQGGNGDCTVLSR